MVLDVLDDDTRESIRETLDSTQTTLDTVSGSINKIEWPLTVTIERIRDILEQFNTTDQPKIGSFIDGLPKLTSDVDSILTKIHTSEQPKIDTILDSFPPVVNNVDSVVKRFNTIEQPSIEKSLDDIHASIARFHHEEQPRVEKLMDSVNHTVNETTTVLKSVDQSVMELKLLIIGINKNIGKIQAGLDFITKYRLPILIVVSFTALIWVAISIMVLYILIKIAFGPVRL